jgi:FixJ family two-component response regulator
VLLDDVAVSDRKRIIILDDDASMLAAVERVVKAAGFDAQAFGAVQTFLDEADFDQASCLVLDIDLDGRCGIELRRRLAREGVSIPVIFITALDREAIGEAARQAGCVALLRKPFPSRQLIDAVELSLRSEAAGSA